MIRHKTARENAQELLQYYLEKSGLPMKPENRIEIEAIVNFIIEAAVQEIRRRLEAQNNA